MMFDMDIFLQLGYAILYGFIVSGFIYIAKVFADFRIKSIYDADIYITQEQNLAVAIKRAGIYIGIALAMISTIGDGFKSTFVSDIQGQLLDGVLILIFMLLATFINDRLILRGIKNDIAIKDGNISVSIVEFGSYIATALIAYGSFYGSGPWYSSIVFFILGQVSLIILMYIYEKLTDYSIIEEIKNSNISAAIIISGMMIAFGFILKASILGDFISWQNDILYFIISAISGLLILLILSNKFVDSIFIPYNSIDESVKNGSISSVLVVVSVKIAIAIVVGAVIL